MKKILFHSNNLGLRGTEIAMYNYADYNEKILGNKSYIISSPRNDLSAYDKFASRFEVTLTDFGSYGHVCQEKGIDFVYFIKAGGNDGLWMSDPPSLVHAVFRANDPHGHRYRYVSNWLAKDQGYDPDVWAVPHMVEPLPAVSDNLRSTLGIPEGNTVFGCYAGPTEFNINWVHGAIHQTVLHRRDVTFLFMNINRFGEVYEHPQIIFLDGTHDLHFKARFIASCDAMIHARGGGETFGCAVSEFAIMNKPVVTYGLSGEASHLEILGERAIRYNNYEEVLDIFNNLKNYLHYDDYNLPYLDYSPEIIMEKFNNRFLK